MLSKRLTQEIETTKENEYHVIIVKNTLNPINSIDQLKPIVVQCGLQLKDVVKVEQNFEENIIRIFLLC